MCYNETAKKNLYDPSARAALIIQFQRDFVLVFPSRLRRAEESEEKTQQSDRAVTNAVPPPLAR